MRRWRRGRGAAVAGVALLAVTAGCGGQQPGAARSSASRSVTVEADGTQVIALGETDQYRFTPEEPHVHPGPVRIDFRNTSTTNTHSLAFKPGGPTAEIPFVNPGEKKSIKFDIQTPGEYRFFCTFHESLGQRGVLVVDPS
ncbi:cupredoxin domain-containing protein [Cumulibacter manganitolerans]|uniref:cupredoxin domain-containing protein n=1 Tax=Cumulibacter manganitolerans TaxID=1884992 RepID=UPI0018860B74|nr:cupredoxin domain-containing protein [Cumulibacter manganitolerans]